MLDMTENEKYLATARHAAREAGKVLLHHLGDLREIEVKNAQQFNLVTEADRNSERRIVDILLAEYPDHGVLGEEGGAHNTGAAFTWIIDPLDGTTNYTHAFPIFSISIALEREGELIAGVVYAPVRDELFHAARGAGAFLNEKRIHVSDTSRIEKAMLVTGFPYNIRENPDHCYERFIGFLKEAQAIRRLGSAALDCAYVAAGRLDGFWEVSLQPWDKAAGHLLIEEAGGRVSDFSGAPHDIYKLPFLGSNGHVHGDMLRVLEEAKSLVITMKERD